VENIIADPEARWLDEKLQTLQKKSLGVTAINYLDNAVIIGYYFGRTILLAEILGVQIEKDLLRSQQNLNGDK